MVRISRVLVAVAAAGLLVSGCTVKKTERPPLVGPSELALSLNVTANPDILTQDGSSQSRVVVMARDQNGAAVTSLPLHVSLTANQQVASAGSLSGSDATTGSDGRATITYTAPPLPASNQDQGLVVTINVTPIGTDFANAVPRTVSIRLVPPGVVPAGPVAAFTYSPVTPVPNSAVTFDASTSQAGSGTISSYAWDFGDGTYGTGMTAQHSYRGTGDYTVKLVLTDNQGRTSNTCTQTITVGEAYAPTANFVFSPSTGAIPNQTIFFDASASSPGAGRTLVDYAWNFGNGSIAHGVTATASYSAAGTYAVTLTVTDDVGRTNTKTATVIIADPTAPTADFSFSPSAPAAGATIYFNASASRAATGRTIVSYSFDFLNGTTETGTSPTTQSNGSLYTTSYASAGTYTVILVVTDDVGHKGIKTQTITVH